MWIPKYQLHLNMLKHKGVGGVGKVSSILIQNHPLLKHNCLIAEQRYSLAQKKYPQIERKRYSSMNLETRFAHNSFSHSITKLFKENENIYTFTKIGFYIFVNC